MSSRSGLVLWALVLAVGSVAACQSGPGVASPAPAHGPLVTITIRGGECPDGPCGGTTVIEQDGRIHMTAPVKEFGRLSGELLDGLHAAVRATDFEAVRARQFTGECPVNFDGQEFIYEISAPGRTERIATCETEIDPDHPLFAAISAVLGAIEEGAAP